MEWETKRAPPAAVGGVEMAAVVGGGPAVTED